MELFIWDCPVCDTMQQVDDCPDVTPCCNPGCKSGFCPECEEGKQFFVCEQCRKPCCWAHRDCLPDLADIFDPDLGYCQTCAAAVRSEAAAVAPVTTFASATLSVSDGGNPPTYTPIAEVSSLTMKVEFPKDWMSVCQQCKARHEFDSFSAMIGSPEECSWCGGRVSKGMTESGAEEVARAQAELRDRRREGR